MDDRFDLERFVAAQDDAGNYGRAVSELRRGHKTSHWIWFVFPQIAGLGQSEMSRRFAISSLEEAQAYLAHGVLSSRLHECATILAEQSDRTIEQIFGNVDARKLRSSMTMFMRAGPGDALFPLVLERYFHGAPDGETDDRIRT
ncbi:MAG: DUF1810 domain-containing protein [Acidimicrobiales bacterium]